MTDVTSRPASRCSSSSLTSPFSVHVGTAVAARHGRHCSLHNPDRMPSLRQGLDPSIISLPWSKGLRCGVSHVSPTSAPSSGARDDIPPELATRWCERRLDVRAVPVRDAPIRRPPSGGEHRPRSEARPIQEASSARSAWAPSADELRHGAGVGPGMDEVGERGLILPRRQCPEAPDPGPPELGVADQSARIAELPGQRASWTAKARNPGTGEWQLREEHEVLAVRFNGTQELPGGRGHEGLGGSAALLAVPHGQESCKR